MSDTEDEARRVCGCHFVGLPGRCLTQVFEEGLCPYCDDAPLHRHCAGCGSNAVAFTLEPIEVYCSACARGRVA